MLRYLYSLFYSAALKGGTVARPLFFEWPTDPITLSIDKQFLLGPSLLVSPVLEEGATTVQAYFPKGRWYDFYTGAARNGCGREEHAFVAQVFAWTITT